MDLPCVQAAIACPQSILAASVGDETVVMQNACLPSVAGPLPSNTVYMGVPPTSKRWTFLSSLKDNATLRLGCGMVLCLNVVVLLLAVAVSLLPVAAIVAAIHSLPAHTVHSLAASVGSCNSPAYRNAYHLTPVKVGQFAAGTAAWCDYQAETCSTSSFLSEMGSRVYEQADPVRSIGNQVSPRRVPCRADGCAHFDDDLPDSLPRCISNVSRMEWCPEMLLFLRNASMAGVGVLPPCVMDLLIECNQKAIVTALDWVPTSDIVPPLTCARLAAEDMFTLYSWREPVETLQSCARLMLAHLVLYITFIFTTILGKKLLVGRFQSGTWDLLDVRSNEWIRSTGYALSYIMFSHETLSKALTGSQWQVVLYRLSGLRVGKRVFVDRDVVIMGARKRMPRSISSVRMHERAAVLTRYPALLCPDEDLVLLGDGACVGAGAYLAAHELTRNGKLKRGPIVVGADCTVGPSARLTPHVTVEAGCNVPALACALPGETFRRRSQAKGD